MPTYPYNPNRHEGALNLPKIDRRTALKLSVGAGILTVLGGIGEGTRRILSHRAHIEHSTQETLQELQRHHAEEVMKDPERWFRTKMNRLRAPRNVRRATHCSDGGVTLQTMISMLLENGDVTPEERAELLQGRIPPTLDDYSIPGPGSRHAPRPELHARIPDGRCCGVAGHDQCGACDGRNDVAEEAARNFARSIGAPYLGMVRHLDRPAGFHPETGATIRTTPDILNPRREEGTPENQQGYPPYFDYTAWGVRDRAARVGHYKLMKDIVLSNHGAGAALQNGIPYAGTTLNTFRLNIPFNEDRDQQPIEDELDEGFDGLSTEKVWIRVPRQ